jgi:hypothetical protein
MKASPWWLWAAILVGLLIFALTSGVLIGRYRLVFRQENPWAFWLGITALGLGAFFAAGIALWQTLGLHT